MCVGIYASTWPMIRPIAALVVRPAQLPVSNVPLVYVNVLRVRPFAMANASTYKLMLTTAVYAARDAPQGLRVQPEPVTARRTRQTFAGMPALI